MTRDAGNPDKNPDPHPGDSPEMDAAAYAAGLFSAEERERFERFLESAPECFRRQVEDDLETAAAVGMGAAPETRAPAALRARVLKAIEDDDSNAGPGAGSVDPGGDGIESFTFIGEPDGEWLPLPTRGARVKTLSDLPEEGRTVFILELDPGVTYPSHRHGRTEEIFLLSGDLHSGRHRLRPGDYLRGAPGSTHHDLYSPSGCRALVVAGHEDFHPKPLKLLSKVRSMLSALKPAPPPPDTKDN